MGRGKRRPLFSLPPSHRAPRALFFFLPSLPTTQKPIHNTQYKEASAEERVTAYRYSPSLLSRRFRAVSGAKNEKRESVSFFGSRSISRATTENPLPWSPGGVTAIYGPYRYVPL